MHVRAISKIPDLVLWSAEQASTPAAVVAAREQTRLPDDPAQLYPDPYHRRWGARCYCPLKGGPQPSPGFGRGAGSLYWLPVRCRPEVGSRAPPMPTTTGRLIILPA